MNIILFGPPGAGKGTQAKMICQQYNLLHLSTGEILRNEIKKKTNLGKDVEEIIKLGKLVSNEIIIEILNSTIVNKLKDNFSGYLFDGFPRNINQANLLSNLLDSLKVKIDYILLIEVDEQTLLHRILTRGDSEGRSDDNQETLASRIQVYVQETEPLIDHYSSNHEIKKIDGLGKINEVNQRINNALGGL